MPIQKFTSLPDLLKRPETLVVPGGGTALELRLAQLAGFEAGYVSGYATSAAVFGVPDVGLGDVMPDPANIPPGCRFHPRCPIAEPRCSTETPPLRPRPGGGVECLLVP